MPLIRCPCCGRRRNVAKRGKGRLRCSQCGAVAAQVVHRIKAWMETDDADGLERDQARHSVMGQLKWWAKQKGFKPVWAKMKFIRLFGTEPNGETKEPPQVPTAELLRWMRLEGEAYKRAMRKAGIPFKPKARSVKPATFSFDTATPAERESMLMNGDDWEVKL